MDFKILGSEDFEQILMLGFELNSEQSADKLRTRLKEMFDYPNYGCFGIYHHSKSDIIFKENWKIPSHKHPNNQWLYSNLSQAF